MHLKLLIAAAVVITSSGIASAQTLRPGLWNRESTDNDHYYWVYRQRVSEQGNSLNRAVALHIFEGQGDFDAPERKGTISGKYYVYREPDGDSDDYQPRTFFNKDGEEKNYIELVGKYTRLDGSTTRQRRTDFQLQGKYRLQENSQLKVLGLRGYFHPGKNTAPGSREGDRLTIRRVLGAIPPAGATPNPSAFLNSLAQQLESSGLLEEDEQKLILLGVKILLNNTNCDEQADDDVMEEEALGEPPTGEEAPGVGLPPEEAEA